MESLAYVRALLRDRNVGAIAPTSRFGIRAMLNFVDFSKTSTFVEFGPGRGVITREVLKRLSPSAKLIAIERNPDFYRSLERRIRDPRLHLFNDSAENIGSILSALTIESVNYVISGIPFSMFPEDLKDRILTNTMRALAHDGKLIVYQYHDMSRKLGEHSKVSGRAYEFRNIPPLKIVVASRN
jgi:phospholipid N-methyltransferase